MGQFATYQVFHVEQLDEFMSKHDRFVEN